MRMHRFVFISLISSCALLNAQISEKTMELKKANETQERPEVGMLDMGCTAIMISDKCFISSAHCFDFKAIVKGGTFTFNTSNGNKDTIERNIEKTFCIGHMDHAWSKDLAVGILTQKIPEGIKFASISSRQPNKGEILTVMGYGATSRSSTYPGLGIKRYREYKYNGNTNHLCGGDSGGPVFLDCLKCLGDIIRINAGHTEGPIIEDRDHGADAVQYRDHIYSLVNALENPGLFYRVHVADHGWLPAVRAEEVASGKIDNNRIEAIQIWSNDEGIEINYQGHIQDYKWENNISKNGELCGTKRQSKRLEAIRIWSTGKNAKEISYQVRIHSKWQNIINTKSETANAPFEVGTYAGTVGKGYSLEAIKIWYNN